MTDSETQAKTLSISRSCIFLRLMRALGHLRAPLQDALANKSGFFPLQLSNLPGVVFVDEEDHCSGALLKQSVYNSVKVFGFRVPENFFCYCYADSGIG